MAQKVWPDSIAQAYYELPAMSAYAQSPLYRQKPELSNQPCAQPAAQYIQPSYAGLGAAPFIAELPAPLPAAPPTTTPQIQLTEDEQLARKLSAPDQQLTEDEELAKRLQHLEVQEARSRSNSNVSQQQRPVSMVVPSQQWAPPLAQQRSLQSLRPQPQMGPPQSFGLASRLSTQTLRPHAQSLSETVPRNSMQSLRPHSQSLSEQPWSPGSFGPPPHIERYSSLPEAISEHPSQILPSQYSAVAPMSNLPEVVTSNVHTQPSSTTLSAYLEKHRQSPYPPQWKLRPVVKTYHARPTIRAKGDWLDTPESSVWSTNRRSEEHSKPPPAVFSFTFKRTGGSYRDPRFSWIMSYQTPDLDSKKRPPVWSYELRMDLKSTFRKSEVLKPGGCKSNILTTYVHAANYDSLRFIGNDGKAYQWVSHMPLRSTHGGRFDMLRHALFVARDRNTDPLFGDIVADHAYWDGFDKDTRVHKGVICMECSTKPIPGQRWQCRTCPDHNVCGWCYSTGSRKTVESTCKLVLTCVPDETLWIRSPIVDPALVVASLQILKDWQKNQIRLQKERDPKGFMLSEIAAREQELGRLSHWKGSDMKEKLAKPQKVQSKVESKEAAQKQPEVSGALGNLMDAGLALAARGQQGGNDEPQTGPNAHIGDR